MMEGRTFGRKRHGLADFAAGSSLIRSNTLELSHAILHIIWISVGYRETAKLNSMKLRRYANMAEASAQVVVDERVKR